MAAPIALLTDFGTQDTYVGVMKGVIAGIAPGAQVIDVTHSVPPGDIRRGAFYLWQAAGFFPEGTIFAAVVDPGVRTARKGIAAAWGGKLFVLPDNGLLTYFLASREPDAAHEIRSPDYRLHPVSSTFHGRDVFAPAAAHLALGAPLDTFGPPVERLARFSPPVLGVHSDTSLEGQILHADRFGNMITSIGRLRPSSDALILEPWLAPATQVRLPSSRLHLELPDGSTLALRTTFGDVDPGEALAYIGSEGLVEIAVNQGNAAEELSIAPGERVTLRPMD